MNADSILKMRYKILDLIGEYVRGGGLDRSRKVQYQRIVSRRIPLLIYPAAYLNAKISVSCRKILRRVLKLDFCPFANIIKVVFYKPNAVARQIDWTSDTAL